MCRVSARRLSSHIKLITYFRISINIISQIFVDNLKTCVYDMEKTIKIYSTTNVLWFNNELFELKNKKNDYWKKVTELTEPND
jgi:hypothetical protein